MWKHLDNPLSVSSSLVIVVLITVVVVQGVLLAEGDDCEPCNTAAPTTQRSAVAEQNAATSTPVRATTTPDGR